MKKCLICKNKLAVNQKKFCSKKCYGTYLRENPSKRNHFKEGAKAWNKGVVGYHAGELHYKWKGGKRAHSSGYTETYDSSEKRTLHGTYRYEHRKVVEDFIGRKLGVEHIHHINGDKKDNRLKNLYIFSSNSQHTIHHKQHGNPELISNLKDFIHT